MITPLYLSLFVHTVTLFVTGQSPPYTPKDTIVLACGNSGLQTSNDLRKWIGDNGLRFTPTGNSSESIAAPRSSTAAGVPYTRARLSRSEFTYKIPLSPGHKFIRLHFNPDTYNPDFQRSNSLFSVTAGRFTLLKDFNASVTADASNKLQLVREFCVNVEQRLDITFVEVPEYSAPKLVYNTGRSMGMNKTINKSYNLTWIFPLDPKFYYPVRLHFYIIGWSGAKGTPVYKDYVVFMPHVRSQKKVNLFLELAALQQDWLTIYNDAILNRLEIFKLSDSNGNLAAPNTPQLWRTSQNPEDTEDKKLTPKVAIFASVVAGFITLSVLTFLVSRRRWKLKESSSGSRQIMKANNEACQFKPNNLSRYFSLAEIKAATKNFSDTFIIGAGGFGNVYKGCIDGGATLVAIKRLKPESSQGAHEFKTEIEMLSQLRHRHLVSLIGYCADKGEMILVYDYMAHGTLRDHLYHTNNPPLPWEQRLQICIGTARGLQYLHSGAKGTIIHRDVKSTNILLDDIWMAKVSDFGLSKGTTNMSKTHISTVVKGSFGYLDPEYYRQQRLTEKSDVYSLGVVLFEVLCARPAVIQAEELKQASLAEWAKICHQNGELDEIIDPNLRGKIKADCLIKFTEVAISCMRDNGTERPSMTNVVRGLELALQLQQSAEGDINCTEKIVET